MFGDVGDILFGGAGRDTFVVSTAFDRNNIRDFNAAEDKIVQASTQNKFSAQYFGIANTITNLNQINFTGVVTASEEVSTVGHSSTTGSFYTGGASDYFAARYTGAFEAASAGTYSFKLTSDDGARLYIDGVAKIDMPNLQDATARTTDITLSQGFHNIEVQYFEAMGDAVLNLEWDQPGGSTTFETMVL